MHRPNDAGQLAIIGPRTADEVGSNPTPATNSKENHDQDLKLPEGFTREEAQTPAEKEEKVKRLLALLCLISLPVFAQQAYSIKTNKETIEIHQADGIVVTIPRAKPVVEAVNGEVLIMTLAKMEKKGEPGEHLIMIVNMQKFCLAGAGKVGIMDPEGKVLLGLMPYDNKVNSVAKFVGNYLCQSAGINGKAI